MGYFRLYLALCVMNAHHIYLPGLDIFIFNGYQAVQCFFVLSGFFIALTLDKHYTLSGTLSSFYWNRVLRVLPAYWFVLALIIMLLFVGVDMQSFQKTWHAPRFIDTLSSHSVTTIMAIIISNITIVGQDLFWLMSVKEGGLVWQPYGSSMAHNGSMYLLVVPAFTLAMELYFYAFAPLLQRWRGLIGLVFIVGIGYQVAMHTLGWQWQTWGYHVAFSAIYYFMLGMVAYHTITRASKSVRAGAILGFIVLSMIGWHGGMYAYKVSYGFAPLLAIAVALCYQLGNKQRLNILCGYLSYTFYIVHFPVLYYIVPMGIEKEFVWVAVLVTALIIHYGIERPAWKLRSRPTRMQTATA